MADIFTLIDEYKELMDEKDRLKDATTENNKALEKKRNELAQAMIDAESPKVSRGGFLYSLQDKTKYNKIGGCDEDGFFETLEEHGLGDIIKRTVNAQTLNGAMAGLVEENDGELPEDFEEYIEALIRRVDVPVKAILGKTKVAVNDFLNLQVGDIIRLDTDIEQDLKVYVGNIKKFTALPGSSKDKYAVRVTSVVREGE